MTIHDVKDDPILQVPSQELSTSSKYGIRGRGALDKTPPTDIQWQSQNENWMDH